MGRHAFRYQITGYLVGPSYNETKRELMRVLDSSAGGSLIDPYLAEPLMCMCERYSVTETRDRGGYCVFDMAFVELGGSGNSVEQTDSKAEVQNKAADTGNTAASNLDAGTTVPSDSAFA
jgi:prophage DNA circulation protein